MAQSRINEIGALQGHLSTNKELTGQINSIQTLRGTISAPNTLKGAINTCPSLIGKINLKENLKGTITVPSEHYEHYEGKYTVTPKTISQTLHTANLVMDDNVTVLEIPYFETANETGDTVYIGGN